MAGMELFSFLRLYASDDINTQYFLVMMAILYFNAGCYIVDLYGIVKKKTAGETIAVMLLPGTLAVIGSFMIGLLTGVPATQKGLAVFASALESKGLAHSLINLVLLYAAVWVLAWNPKGQHRQRSAFVRWVLSCIPDFLFAALLLVCSCCRIVSGVSVFALTEEWSFETGMRYDIFLWIFLNMLMAFICKTALLICGIFTRIYSHRIPHKWREGKSPVRYVISHFCIFQNALLRGSLAFWAFELSVIMIPMVMYGELKPSGAHFKEMLFLIVFMFAGFFLVNMVVMKRPLKTIFRFWQWGDHRELMTLFCRETCVEKPLIAGGDYTVTEHFLIDEQSPAGVYYLSELESCSGWLYEKNGWIKRLSFRDGQILEINKNEPSAEEVAAAARRHLDMHAVENIQKIGLRTPKSGLEKKYDSMMVRLVAITVSLLMLGGYVMNVRTDTSYDGFSAKKDSDSVKIPAKSTSPYAVEKKTQSADANGNNNFPMLAASNDDLNIYVTKVATSVYSQHTENRNGKVYIVNDTADRITVEIRDRDDALIQRMNCLAIDLDIKYTDISGKKRMPKFASLEDVNFDGFDDLVLMHANKEVTTYCVYFWDNGIKKFTDDKNNPVFNPFFVDDETHRIVEVRWDNESEVQWFTAYTYDDGIFSREKAICVYRDYEISKEDSEKIYEEWVFVDGEKQSVSGRQDYDGINAYWKRWLK